MGTMIHERWDTLYIPEPNTGCWLWTGTVDQRGYATKGWYPAYRLFWEMENGPTPNGLCCCHSCDNRLCVNPGHIFLGTTKDNMRDKVRKGRCQDQRGEKAWNAKLTAEQIIAIVNSTDSQQVLSARYGVGQGHISRIRRGVRWGHLVQHPKTSSGRNPTTGRFR